MPSSYWQIRNSWRSASCGTFPALEVLDCNILSFTNSIRNTHLTYSYALQIPNSTMSREAYVAPTLQPQTSTAISEPTTQYSCGECNAKVQLKKGDPIRCKDCGHRVLYKERTKRYAGLGLVFGK